MGLFRHVILSRVGSHIWGRLQLPFGVWFVLIAILTLIITLFLVMFSTYLDVRPLLLICLYHQLVLVLNSYGLHILSLRQHCMPRNLIKAAVGNIRVPAMFGLVKYTPLKFDQIELLAQVLLDVFMFSLTSLIKGRVVTSGRRSIWMSNRNPSFSMTSRPRKPFVARLGTIQALEYILILKQVTDIFYRGVINGGQHDSLVFLRARQTGNRSCIDFFRVISRS